MIRSLSHFFTGIMQRWLPDALIFAIVLTLVVLMAGVLGEGQPPGKMIQFWGGGIWNLLTFSMQVIITLVTGSVLAQTGPVKRALEKLANLANTPEQAIVLMTAVALVCCWISWGFGLIATRVSLPAAGGLGLFRPADMARRVIRLHTPQNCRC